MRRVLATLTVLAVSLSMQVSASASALDDFAISVPGEPLTGGPGDTIQTSIRVTNRTSQPMRYTLKTVSLDAEDQGLLRVVDRFDPFVHSVEHQDTVEIGPTSYTEVPVTLHIPADAAPDIYLLGFSVQPERPANGNLDVRTAAANHITIEVPGTVRRSLAVENVKFPRFLVARSVKGNFDVVNDGEATARFRGDVRVDSALDEENIAIISATGSGPQELLPKGLRKTFDYEWTPSGPASFVRPSVQLSLVDGRNGVRSVSHAGQSLLIVHPITVVAALFLLGLVVALVARRRFPIARATAK